MGNLAGVSVFSVNKGLCLTQRFLLLLFKVKVWCGFCELELISLLTILSNFFTNSSAV